MESNSCKEEQDLELQALESIFEKDFARTSEGFEITLRPFPNGKSKDNHKIALVRIEYGSTYPNTVPRSLQLANVKGLKDEHLATLTGLANRKVEESIGHPMVFDMLELLRDWLLSINVKEADSLHDKIREQMEQEEIEKKQRAERESAEKEEAEKKKYQDDEGDEADNDNVSTIVIPPNTATTDENFAWWNNLFLDEQAKRRAAMLEAKGHVEQEQPTGRQIFLQNLIQDLGDFDGDNDENVVEHDAGATKPDEVFWFNESIYEDAGDIDMDEVLRDDANDEQQVGQVGVSASAAAESTSALQSVAKERTESTAEIKPTSSSSSKDTRALQESGKPKSAKHDPAKHDTSSTSSSSSSSSSKSSSSSSASSAKASKSGASASSSSSQKGTKAPPAFSFASYEDDTNEDSRSVFAERSNPNESGNEKIKKDKKDKGDRADKKKK